MSAHITKTSFHLFLVLFCFLPISCSQEKGKAEYARFITNAYRSMRIGDWAFYRLTDNYSVMMQVVDKHDGNVVIKRRTYYMGSPVAASYKLTYNLEDIERNLENGFDIEGKIPLSPPVVSRKSVEIEGNTLDCRVFTMKTKTAELSFYLSEEVPLDGVVMVTRNGIRVRKLAYFGRGGEPMKIPWTPDIENE